jgi:hypothetical protein
VEVIVKRAPDAGRRAARNRLILLGLFAVALVPMVLAYLLAMGLQGGQPWSMTNHGELVEPLVNVATLGLRDVDGQPAFGHERSPAWWLLLITGDDCGADCEQALFTLRQLHVLLQRDAHRVRRGIVFAPELPDFARWQDIAGRYPQLTPFSARDASVRQGIFIVDPLHNLVLFYDYAAAGKPVLEDLKKLLKASQVG